MKNWFVFWFLCMSATFTPHIVMGQNLEHVSSEAQAQHFAERLSAHLRGLESEFQLKSEKGSEAEDMNTGEPIFGTLHHLESRAHLVRISIGVSPNEEKAKGQLKDVQYSSGSIGSVWPNFGDEAYTWHNGRVKARKGRILISIIVDSKEELERNQQENNQPEPETVTDAQRLERKQWKAEIDQGKRAVAERFAKQVLEFLESER